MNILTDALPESLIICGRLCHINSDFKTWLSVSEMLSGGTLTAAELPKLLYLVFGDMLPPKLGEALEAIAHFYTYDARTHAPSAKQASVQSKKYFDFTYDADLIFSAFMQQYGIDLCESHMHWYKFKALFGGLSDETLFMKVMRIRSTDVSKIKDKGERHYYLKMKALYKLPDRQSDEQKELALKNAMATMF